MADSKNPAYREHVEKLELEIEGTEGPIFFEMAEQLVLQDVRIAFSTDTRN